ncbi:MAG TPA: hypothetical protein GX731_04275 [Clostridiales bacterium]|nr:hypothetical protein [Clostridiales bacterium]
MREKYKGIINSNNSRRTLNGSFTVEATIIIPLIFFLIFALFYLGFYLYDLNRIQAVIDKSLNKAGLTIKNEVNLINGNIYYDKIKDRPIFSLLSQNNLELEKNMRDYLNIELNPGLFIMDICHKEIEITSSKIKIVIVAKSRISQRGVMKYFDQMREQRYEGIYKIYNPADFIRKAEIVLDTGSGIKGLDELKENIAKMLR